MRKMLRVALGATNLTKTIIVAVVFVCLTDGQAAFAQAVEPASRQVDVGNLTNCTAAAINAAVNCEVRCTSSTCPNGQVLGTLGFNLLTLEIAYTWSAGGGVQFYLQSCNEGMGPTACLDSTDWYDVQAIAVAAGTGTLTDFLVSKTGLAASKKYVYSIAVNYQRLRLYQVVATGAPDANDKVTIRARLSNSPAF